MSAPVRVYLVDDHPMVIEGLTSALSRCADVEVIGSARTAEDGLLDARMLDSDVVVVDYGLPGATGASFCAELVRRGNRPRCLVLSGSDLDDAVVDSFAAGALGYVLKDVSAETLADVIGTVHAGEIYVDPRVAGKVVRGLRQAKSSGTRLGNRERELLAYIAQGLSNVDISKRMHVSPSSVKNYVSRLLTSLGVDSRTAAVAKAAKEGLL